jgi:hypothetical protein
MCCSPWGRHRAVRVAFHSSSPALLAALSSSSCDYAQALVTEGQRAAPTRGRRDAIWPRSRWTWAASGAKGHGVRRTAQKSTPRLPPKKRKVAEWCLGGGRKLEGHSSAKTIRCEVCGKRLTPRIVHGQGDDEPKRYVPRHKEK